MRSFWPRTEPLPPPDSGPRRDAARSTWCRCSSRPPRAGRSDWSRYWGGAFVQGLALVDDVNREQFEGLITDDRESSVLHVAQVEDRRTGLELDGLSARRLHRSSLQDISGLHAMVDVRRDGVAGLVLGHRFDHLHAGCAGQVDSLEFVTWGESRSAAWRLRLTAHKAAPKPVTRIRTAGLSASWSLPRNAAGMPRRGVCPQRPAGVHAPRTPVSRACLPAHSRAPEAKRKD